MAELARCKCGAPYIPQLFTHAEGSSLPLRTTQARLNRDYRHGRGNGDGGFIGQGLDMPPELPRRATWEEVSLYTELTNPISIAGNGFNPFP
jgi:hypothetical protein